jgi:hypothetical protein
MLTAIGGAGFSFRNDRNTDFRFERRNRLAAVSSGSTLSTEKVRNI